MSLKLYSRVIFDLVDFPVFNIDQFSDIAITVYDFAEIARHFVKFSKKFA